MFLEQNVLELYVSGTHINALFGKTEPKDGTLGSEVPRYDTYFRLLLRSKALSGIDVTLAGIRTDVRFPHKRNAYLAIDVTVDGIVTEVKP